MKSRGNGETDRMQNRNNGRRRENQNIEGELREHFEIIRTLKN